MPSLIRSCMAAIASTVSSISHVGTVSMKTGDSRGFGIADGLILIAGVGAGWRPQGLSPDISPQEIWDAFVRPKETWSLRYALGLFAELSVICGIPSLAAWTLICLIVQFIRPRSSWRRLRRQPGFVACLITTTVIVLTTVASSMSVWLSIWVATRSSPGGFIKAYLVAGILAGSAVLGTG